MSELNSSAPQPAQRVDALVVHVDVLPGERALGARLAKHVVLLGRQALTPLVVGEGDFLVHGAQVLPRLAGLDAYSAAAAAWRLGDVAAQRRAARAPRRSAPQRSSHGRISTSPATSSRTSIPPPGRSVRCACARPRGSRRPTGGPRARSAGRRDPRPAPCQIAHEAPSTVSMSKSSGTAKRRRQQARRPDPIEAERPHLARHRVAREHVDVPSFGGRLDEVGAQIASRLVALGVDVANLDLAMGHEAVDDRALDLEPLGVGRLPFGRRQRPAQVLAHHRHAQRAGEMGERADQRRVLLGAHLLQQAHRHQEQASPGSGRAAAAGAGCPCRCASDRRSPRRRCRRCRAAWRRSAGRCACSTSSSSASCRVVRPTSVSQRRANSLMTRSSFSPFS